MVIAAAKQCLEMFELVPSNIQDVDKRRFNKILGQDKAGKKHSFKPVVASPSSQPLFTVEFPRFRGHLILWENGGQCQEQDELIHPSFASR